MLQNHGDTARREEGTRRRGDKVRGRQDEGEFKSPCICISSSHRFLVPLSSLLLVFLSPALWLCLSVAGQTGSFENRAIFSAQEMSAPDLAAALPARPFAGWLSEVIGPKAGVVWQLAECGDPPAAWGGVGQDLPACA